MSLHERLQKADGYTRENVGASILQFLDDEGIPIEMVGKAKIFMQGSKDADGNMQAQALPSIELAPAWAAGPQWPVAEKAKPVKIPKVPSGRPVAPGGFNDIYIVPDMQVGYRRHKGGLVPFHDERCMDLHLQMIRHIRPQHVCMVGDNLDFADLSRFVREVAFVETMQPSIDRWHLFLSQVRAIVPDAEITWIEGNHEHRLPKQILENAAWSFGLKKANTPDDWPVLSVQSLCRLDELGVDYKEGYPSAEKWYSDHFLGIHGAKVRSGGSTAAAYVKDESISVVFGHIHRKELQYRTWRHARGRYETFAASPGTGARVDGGTPSVKAGVKGSGKLPNSVEDWQQGAAVVRMDADGFPSYSQIDIRDGRAWWGPHHWESTVDMFGNKMAKTA